MSDLPAPLVPAEVDLRDFAFMPLDVVRLRDCDLAALVSAESFRAAVILWCAAWHQVPAASLPCDDLALARLAGYGRDLTGWRKAKDGALRGFIICDDGRLYHPVIAEKATGAWEAKKSQRARTAAATAARLARQRVEPDERHEPRHEPRNEARNVDRNEPRRGDVTFTKGQGEGDISSLRSDRARRTTSPKPTYPPDAFERWWSDYPEKVGKGAAQRSFERIRKAGAVPFETLLHGVEAYRKAKPSDRAWCNPATWLNQERWLDEPYGAPKAEDPARIDFGGGVTWPEQSVRTQVAHWRRDPSTWPADRLGPPPGEPGCRLPDHLLREAA